MQKSVKIQTRLLRSKIINNIKCNHIIRGQSLKGDPQQLSEKVHPAEKKQRILRSVTYVKTQRDKRTNKVSLGERMRQIDLLERSLSRTLRQLNEGLCNLTNTNKKIQRNLKKYILKREFESLNNLTNRVEFLTKDCEAVSKNLARLVRQGDYII